jgi:ATP-dependent helicase Lhr and Lhr-like helicase
VSCEGFDCGGNIPFQLPTCTHTYTELANKNSIESVGSRWFSEQGWTPFDFQLQAWRAHAEGKCGIVNAPTGSGKTYSLLVPSLLHGAGTKHGKGVKIIWITPIRALSKEIELSAKRAIEGLDLKLKVGVRSGDTKQKDREKQKISPPDLLITTPESLHLLMAQKGYPDYFKNLHTIVVDEWHELMGSKRGVQMELALSRLKGIVPDLKIWGISATISNMDEALEVLLGTGNGRLQVDSPRSTTGGSPASTAGGSPPSGGQGVAGAVVIKSNLKKEVEVVSILPDKVELLPWSGHLGIHLIDKTIPIIQNSTSTLVFTNTRSFAEIWYQKLLDRAPELSGQIAMHHGSISQQTRHWVEDQLHLGKLKCVVCTSSLDLGVDFRPVETVIQVGSPKGIARFLQRAGRSGHQPGAVSKIFFLPTHSLELVEAAAIREGMKRNIIEERIPYTRSFDVLIQYLMTLAVSDGFDPKEIFEEIKTTFSFHSINEDEWNWLLNFITTGGNSLTAYDEFRKVEIINGIYKVENRSIAHRHKLSVGTIVGDISMMVKYVSGKYLGSIEEYFISRLSPGDVFWFAGKALELVRVKDMEAQVRKSKKKSGRVPSWQGGRMPLSSQMGAMIRVKIDEVATRDPLTPEGGTPTALSQESADYSIVVDRSGRVGVPPSGVRGSRGDIELSFIKPLTDLQKSLSHVPTLKEFLVEYIETEDGHHVMMYPFEGRFVHEGMASLVAYRISQIKPISFSIAMNDYGFELLADQEIPLYEALETDLLGEENLLKDIQASVNNIEMARRKFRDIAAISGLVFKGFPGKMVKDRHLQSSSQLFFNVFHEYDSSNLLLHQSFEEVMDFQLEEARMRTALKRIASQKIIVKHPPKPTPFSFPIMVDRLREKLTSESLGARIRKMSV